MDLLYSRYARPTELMRIYIDQGRFGEFVSEVIRLDNERKHEESKRDEDNKLWLAYLMSMSDVSFNQWKSELGNKSKQHETLSMTDEQVDAVKQKAKGILSRFSPA